MIALERVMVVWRIVSALIFIGIIAGLVWFYEPPQGDTVDKTLRALGITEFEGRTQDAYRGTEEPAAE
jgi:hypothetical protein